MNEQAKKTSGDPNAEILEARVGTVETRAERNVACYTLVCMFF
jgi:hypothetical protein